MYCQNVFCDTVRTLSEVEIHHKINNKSTNDEHATSKKKIAQGVQSSRLKLETASLQKAS